MFAFGMSVAMIGITVVFASLFLLMMVIKAQGVFITWLFGERKSKVVTQSQNIEKTVVAEYDDDTLNEELIAVITAAMVAATGKQVTIGQIKRIDTNSSWVQSAKFAQVQGRV